MITLLLWAVIFGALAWLFKSIFPLPGWLKMTGFVLYAILCGYFSVIFVLSITGLPPTLRWNY